MLDAQSARRLAGVQVDDVCCALLASDLTFRDLRRILPACPALLACKPAALTAQAGTPACSQSGCSHALHASPVRLPVMLPDEVAVSFPILRKALWCACCNLQRACHSERAAACG